MNDDPFLHLHRGMTRQGPGTPEDVRWALSLMDLPEHPRVMDAGCGPGADLVTLAETLPRAQIEGMDFLPHLVDEARAATAQFTNVSVSVGDMSRLTGAYDFIWCAGALYFLGITEGLTLWRKSLTENGAIAFSEPTLSPDAPQAAKDFWDDYPAITDQDGLNDRIHAAGYEILGQRRIEGMAWAGYYGELSNRIAKLRPNADAALLDVLNTAEHEISLWRSAPTDVTYSLMVVRPARA